MTGHGGWEIPLGRRTTFMDRGFVGLKDLRRVTDFLYLLRFSAFTSPNVRAGQRRFAFGPAQT